MHLKKLTCDGFKSFADPTEFLFHRGLTAIVGPNGCGKSNVVDAFRWVLGERSAKGLRGKEMLDVIFKGTRNRPALSRAEVTLTFDNSDGTLPLDHAEVEVSRRLFRSGESEYLINRKTCRLKDVLALIQGTGIGTDGYSVLEQGAVDTFLHANPADRRAIFEEAAGISGYRKQAHRARNQLARVDGNLARLGDIITEVERRIRSVKIQAGKARRYLEDRDLALRLRAVIGEAELVEFRAERELVTFRLADIQVRRRQHSEIAECIDELRTTAQGHLERLREGLVELRKEEMEARMALERCAQRRAHIAERREELLAAGERRARQHRELDESMADYRRQRDRVRTQVREGIDALRTSRAQLAGAEEERRAIQAARAELNDGIVAAKEQMQELVFAATRRGNERTALESELRALGARAERRREEGAEIDVESSRLRDRQESVAAARRTAVEARDTAREQSDLLRTEIARRGQRLDENQRVVARLREELEGRRARLRVLEELERSQEGVGSGARTLLQLEAPVRHDVLGLLADHIEAEPDVAPLVDAVLDHHAETVLVWADTPLADRARVVGTLLEGKSARISPIGTGPATAHHSASPRVRGTVPPGCERLIERVRCHPVCQPLLDELLGDVLVTRSLDHALELTQRPDNGHRYVTRDGCIVERWGGVTFSSAEGGLVSRRAEIHRLQEEIERRSGSLDVAREEGELLELTLEARRTALRRVEEEGQRAQLEVESLQQRGAEIDEEMGRLEERRAVVEHELREISQADADARERQAEVVEVIADIERQRAALEEQVRGREEQLHAAEDRLQGALQAVSHARVAATQNEERIVSARREEQRLIGELHERAERVRVLAEEESEDEDRLARYAEEEVELGEEERSQAERCADLERRDRELEEESGGWRKELGRADRLSSALRKQEEQLREVREGLLLRDNEIGVRTSAIREALAEELEMNLAEVPIAQWRVELLGQPETAGAATDGDDEGSDGAAGRGAGDDSPEEHAVAGDLPDGAAQAIDVPPPITPEVLAQLRERLDEAQDRLRRNSNVNLAAVEELGELEERHRSLSEQLDDLTSSRDGLVEIIEELDTQSRTLFLETFAAVRDSFQELFVKIFQGGRADLQLEEGVDVLEAGIQVSATPPGKRINSLQLMSGGEKALTAIAVLFALFRWRPSPFCLLDEVDAPLDEANIMRFVRILQEFHGQAQFVVITHSKVTMGEAESLYGVTMEEEGVSRKLAVRLEEVDEIGDETGHSSTKLRDVGIEAIQHPMARPAGGARELDRPAASPAPALAEGAAIDLGSES